MTTTPSNPMPSRPTSAAISRTCSTFRSEDGGDVGNGKARVLVFTDKEQDTPEVDGGTGEDPRERSSRVNSLG